MGKRNQDLTPTHLKFLLFSSQKISYRLQGSNIFHILVQ